MAIARVIVSLLSLGALAAAAADPVPSTMLAMQKGFLPCRGPSWSCLSVNYHAEVPQPKSGQVLVEMKGSSVNPKDVDCVEPICVLFPLKPDIPFRCSQGTLGGDSHLGGDGSGVVVATAEGCPDLKVGDEVWGFFLGAYAEYAVGSCSVVRPKPKTLNFTDAGTIPGVGNTAIENFKRAGAPWKASQNITVVVSAGQGGTGFMAVQVAKLLGATRVITAAAGAGIEMMKALGVDVVVDYHKQDLFDTLADNSVDVVFDNLGSAGTADKAMPAIRSGGSFILLTGGGKGALSKHPKQGVKQSESGIFTPAASALDELAAGFDNGVLHPHTFQAYGLHEIPLAFTRILGHGVLGKIAITPDFALSPADPAVIV